MIPYPAMSKETFSNQWGDTYIQDYGLTQPHRDNYVIKDTNAFINLFNANNPNFFDKNYVLDSDYGYRIRRSYIEFNGYSGFMPNVDYANMYAFATDTILGLVGLFDPEVGIGTYIADVIFDGFEVYQNYLDSTRYGYELRTLENNPSDIDKGDKNKQREWYLSHGYEEQYWKTDAKKISSSADEPLIFKNPTLDIFENLNYNQITYYWHIESETKEQAYLIYGSLIQIAELDASDNSYNEVDVGLSESYFIIGDRISKEISITDGQKGYMLKNGLNDSFLFKPDYSGNYKFTAPSYAKIELYENDHLIATGNGSLIYNFEKNRNYVFEVVINHFTQKSRQYNVFIQPIEISREGTYSFDDYKEYSGQGIKKIQCSDNIYNLNVYTIKDGSILPIRFSIYDDKLELIQKYEIGNYENSANSHNGNMVINLKNNNCYYVVFDIEYYDIVYLSLSKISDECEVGFIYNKEINCNDMFYKINISYASNYMISLSCLKTNTLSGSIAFAILKYSNGLKTELIVIHNENSNTQIVKELQLLKNDEIYIGYFNGINGVEYSFSIIEKPLFPFSITTETNLATAETGLGTEVTLNGGLRYNNTIAVGFTRVLYLGSDALYRSRYSDYTWETSDPSIATVSAYGTVFAKSQGNVTIRVVDKHGTNNVATIELCIYNKLTDIISIELSTDVNEDYTLNGTEVQQHMGIPGETTIHIGYTRSVCIVSGGPTNIRQDYLWVSSNSRVATVDQYGIIHAKSTGIVVITCTNKYNSSYVGNISITVI